ncbi:DUF4142 domain-containing protein [Nemorincola caseinilytica]
MTRNEADDSFLVSAAHHSLDMREMAHAARSGTADSSVASFTTVIGHTTGAMYHDLQHLAKGALLLPKDPSTGILTKRQQMDLLIGIERDSAFMAYQVAAYEGLIDLFSHQVSYGQFKPVKEYAIKQLPDLIFQKERTESILKRL